ncbi:MAG: hypothetical protein AAGJ35_01780 [Myxococcota bacterium]
MNQNKLENKGVPTTNITKSHVPEPKSESVVEHDSFVLMETALSKDARQKSALQSATFALPTQPVQNESGYDGVTQKTEPQQRGVKPVPNQALSPASLVRENVLARLSQQASSPSPESVEPTSGSTDDLQRLLSQVVGVSPFSGVGVKATVKTSEAKRGTFSFQGDPSVSFEDWAGIFGRVAEDSDENHKL